MGMGEEINNDRGQGKRVFGVVLKGHPDDFQAWLDSAKTYGLYIIFSKSTRTGTSDFRTSASKF